MRSPLSPKVAGFRAGLPSCTVLYRTQQPCKNAPPAAHTGPHRACLFQCLPRAAPLTCAALPRAQRSTVRARSPRRGTGRAPRGSHRAAVMRRRARHGARTGTRGGALRRSLSPYCASAAGATATADESQARGHGRRVSGPQRVPVRAWMMTRAPPHHGRLVIRGRASPRREPATGRHLRPRSALQSGSAPHKARRACKRRGARVSVPAARWLSESESGRSAAGRRGRAV